MILSDKQLLEYGFLGLKASLRVGHIHTQLVALSRHFVRLPGLREKWLSKLRKYWHKNKAYINHILRLKLKIDIFLATRGERLWSCLPVEII